VRFAEKESSPASSAGPFSALDDSTSAYAYRETMIVLKMFPIAGPSNVRTAITTIATNTRINAYSTNP